MDTWIVILIVGAIIVSVAGPIIWIAFVVFLAAKGEEIVAGTFAQPGFSTSELDSLLAQVDGIVRAAYHEAGSGQSVSPQQQLQIQHMMMQAQNQMAQLDNLSRQRYEMRMADLGGMAASAGIDWSPSSY